MAFPIVDNLRIAEDAILAFVCLVILCYMFYAAYKLRQIPMYKMPFTIGMGFVPLFMWKVLGAVRRIAVDSTTYPELSASLNSLGEVFESVSGLVLAIAFIYLYMLLKNTFKMDE